MTNSEIPIRGDPERVCDLCGLVGSSPKKREAVVEGYDESQKTIYQEIRYALALGLMMETEEGIKATNRGIDLSHTGPGEERRAEYFREVIANYEAYATLVSKLFRTPREGAVERRDVDKHLRVGLEMDAGDDGRRRAATLFLRTVEAAGIGVYKKGSSNAPSRLEITDPEALEELLGLLDEHEPSEESPRKAASDETTPTENQNDTVSKKSQKTYGTASPGAQQSQPQIHPAVEIQLTLDGTEDPAQIREIITAVREGLTPEAESHLQEFPPDTPEGTSLEADTEESIDDNTVEGTDDEDDDVADSSPDSSLGDFN